MKKFLLFFLGAVLSVGTFAYAANLAEFEVDMSPSSPEVDEDISLTITAIDNGNDPMTDYNDTVVIKVFVDDDGDRVEADTDMYEFDDGNECNDDFECYLVMHGKEEYELEDVITFTEPGEYKIVVEDESDDEILGDIEFDVEGDSSAGDSGAEELVIRASTSYPDVNEEISLRVEPIDRNEDTVEDYTETLKFNIYAYNDGDREEANEADYSLEDDSYTMNMDGDDFEEMEDYIKFKDDGKFKIEIYENGNEDVSGTAIVTVGDYGASDDEDTATSRSFEAMTNPTSAGVDQAVSVHIVAKGTTTQKIGNVQFVIQKKNDVGLYDAAKSTDFTLLKSTAPAYIGKDMKTIIVDVVKFKVKGQYKIIVQDKANTKVQGEVRLNVMNEDGDKKGETATVVSDTPAKPTSTGSTASTGTTANTPDPNAVGFSEADLKKIGKYKLIRGKLVQILKTKFPGIKTDVSWDLQQKLLLADMQDILDKNTAARHKNFAEFYQDLKDFVKYTATKGKKK